jgi:protein-S-isoprenylcysteine O-methyltransferase Ste14
MFYSWDGSWSADRIFRRIGTNVRPSQPTLALATTGMFTWSRNPMYVGGGLALLGVAIGFALDWVLLLLVVSLPLVHYGIILREDRYLERKFGDEYRRYKTKVPRYWWRFKKWNMEFAVIVRFLCLA